MRDDTKKICQKLVANSISLVPLHIIAEINHFNKIVNTGLRALRNMLSELLEKFTEKLSHFSDSTELVRIVDQFIELFNKKDFLYDLEIKVICFVINFIHNYSNDFVQLGITLDQDFLNTYQVILEKRNQNMVFILEKLLKNLVEYDDDFFDKFSPAEIFVLKSDKISSCSLSYEGEKLNVDEVKIFSKVKFEEVFGKHYLDYVQAWIQIKSGDKKIVLYSAKSTNSNLISELYALIPNQIQNAFLEEGFYFIHKEHDWTSLSDVGITAEEYENSYKSIREQLLIFFHNWLLHLRASRSTITKLCLVEIACGSARMLDLCVEKARECGFEIEAAIGLDHNQQAIEQCCKQYRTFYFEVSDMMNFKRDFSDISQKLQLDLNSAGILTVVIACGAITYFVMDGTKHANVILQQMQGIADAVFLGGLKPLLVTSAIAKAIGYSKVVFSGAANIAILEGKDNRLLLEKLKKQLCQDPKYLSLLGAAHPIALLKQLKSDKMLEQVEELDFTNCTFLMSMRDRDQESGQILKDLQFLKNLKNLKRIQFYNPSCFSLGEMKEMYETYYPIYDIIDGLLNTFCKNNNLNYLNARLRGYFLLAPVRQVSFFSENMRRRVQNTRDRLLVNFEEAGNKDFSYYC